MLNLFIVAAGAFLAGLIQSVTGFGGAIVLMIVLPFFLPLKTATALAGLICIPMCIRIAVVYREKLELKKIPLPLILYMVSSTICIRIAAGADLERFKFAFGVVLILLALYFTLFSGRFHLKPGIKGAVVCSLLSGVTGGLFGMSGPLMVIYYLSAIEDKKAYLGTISLMFAVIESYSAAVRAASGMIGMDMIPWIISGFAAILAGCAVGEKIVDQLNSAAMKRCVYTVLAVAGIITCVKAF